MLSTAPCICTEINRIFSLKHQFFTKFKQIDSISVSMSYVSESTIARCIRADKGITHYRRPKERLTIIAKINTPNNNINPS